MIDACIVGRGEVLAGQNAQECPDAYGQAFLLGGAFPERDSI